MAVVFGRRRLMWIGTTDNTFALLCVLVHRGLILLGGEEIFNVECYKRSGVTERRMAEVGGKVRQKWKERKKQEKRTKVRESVVCLRWDRLILFSAERERVVPMKKEREKRVKQLRCRFSGYFVKAKRSYVLPQVYQIAIGEQSKATRRNAGETLSFPTSAMNIRADMFNISCFTDYFPKFQNDTMTWREKPWNSSWFNRWHWLFSFLFCSLSLCSRRRSRRLPDEARE